MKHILPLLLSVFMMQQVLAQDYVPGLIVVKLKEENKARKSSGNSLSLDRLQQDNAVKNLNAFRSTAKSNKRNSSGSSSLNNLYKLEISESIKESDYINYLKSFENVEYAEQYPNVKPLYVPNDPEAQFGQAQFHLAQINVYDAWNVSQGDESIIIGVIDTGADLDHEDLVNNLYLNEGDPIDGVDNDGDGFVDNYYGWDFADNDNSPDSDGSTHGTGVTGIAAAATDNSTGIAGVGFNTKFMPIKIFQTESNFSRNSYEAIIYAADQGCDVINLSWGNSGRYSQFAQDIINYAVLEKDVVVVAAAGNTDAELDFFPASYDNVLSIGYVNSDDSRNTNATYSDFIDLVAPGVGIYTTENNDTYGSDSGSSYAAPMVAGAAALIRATFPEWNALQVMEQLRVTSEDIYDVSNNSDFLYKFGKGRLNVFKSLADFSAPSIRISNVSYSNGFEEAAYFGDTLDIEIEFTNYLEGTENVAVELTTSSPFVTLLQSEFMIDSLGNFQSVTNSSKPFRVILSEDLPENSSLNFRLLFDGELYNDYQSFQIQSNPKIKLFDYNKWAFGFTATGNLGRSQETPFDNYAVTFDGERLIDHMGAILYVGEDTLRRNTLVNANSYQYLEDFQSFQSLKRYNDITADFDVRSIFQEKESFSTNLGIYIDQRLLGWDDEENFLIHQYKIENRSSNDYDSVYFTLFTDYAITDKSSNTLGYDSDLQLSYAHNENEDEFVGLSLLTEQDSIFYAFDLGTENGHSSDLDNDSLKQSVIEQALFNAFSDQLAGGQAGGNNVGGLHGVMIPAMNASSSATISLALLRANSLAELRALVPKAQTKDALSYTMPPFGRQIFLCLNESPVISAPANSTYEIYSSPTSETALYSGTDFEVGSLSKDSTFYVVEIDSAGISSRRKRVVLTIQKPVASFNLPSEPILIDPGEINSFQFQDQSEGATAWQWHFTNGFTSTKQNPNIVFDTEGEFVAQLIASNAINCSDTVSKTFQVFERAEKPQISDQEVCMNDQLVITDPNLEEITIYTDSLMENQIFKGKEFVLDQLERDTLLYIRNEMDSFPSELVPVNFNVIQLKSKMAVSLDMSIENREMKAIAKSRSELSEKVIWMMGDDTLGTANEIYFDLNKLKEHPLKLIAISESNCIDSTNFTAELSEKPEFDDYYLCQNQSVTLSSTNSQKIYYYADQDLTEYLGKGANVTIDSVHENMSVFAVNVENINPSEVVEVPVFVSDLSADFSLSHDTINLAFEQEIELASQSESVSEWIWEIDDEEIGKQGQLNHQLTETGVFNLKLSVRDTLGCSAERVKKLVVYDDPLLGTKNELRSYFSIYPNPADKFIHLTGKDQFKFDNYSIIDTKGKEVLKADSEKPLLQTEIIDISDLKQGPYYLIIRRGQQEASFLFVIRR